MSVYKHGSLALAHENADLRVPQMKWLGLRCEHMMLAGDDVHMSQGLLNLTMRDRRKAMKMLERFSFTKVDAVDLHTERALQTMLMLNKKAELQLLDASFDGMTALLRSELSGLSYAEVRRRNAACLNWNSLEEGQVIAF